MKNKLIFWAILVGMLSVVFLTLIDNTNFSSVLKFPAASANFVQRSAGLTAFVLLFWQILIGANMQRFTDKLGGWVLKYHIWQGVIIYTLVILHALALLLYRYFIGIGVDPIFVFLGFCLFCRSQLDFYYTLGRVAFWLLTTGVFAGILRTSTPFMRNNWKKFHTLNYAVFLITGIHGYLLGTDFLTQPFFYFSIAAYVLVIYIIIRKLPNLLTTYNKWVN